MAGIEVASEFESFDLSFDENALVQNVEFQDTDQLEYFSFDTALKAIYQKYEADLDFYPVGTPAIMGTDAGRAQSDGSSWHADDFDLLCSFVGPVQIRKRFSVAHGHNSIKRCMVLGSNGLDGNHNIDNDRTHRITYFCRWDR
jgi:hypothetical protein